VGSMTARTLWTFKGARDSASLMGIDAMWRGRKLVRVFVVSGGWRLWMI
jgi:hypothetical protein